MLFIKTFILDIKIVASESMEPTIKKGELVFVSKLAYNIFGIEYNSPKPKQIIAFNREGELLIKRISHINSYGELYVLGDNTNNSEDSRVFGYIKPKQVTGKIIFSFDFKNFSISFF
ncbi:S26 family signal peptidase [bacterium]|nr:MAG: S26 family signal peptidase [bacterium]